MYVCIPVLEATQGNQVQALLSTGSSNPSRGSIEYMACHVTDDYMQPWGTRKEDSNLGGLWGSEVMLDLGLEP